MKFQFHKSNNQHILILVDSLSINRSYPLPEQFGNKKERIDIMVKSDMYLLVRILQNA